MRGAWVVGVGWIISWGLTGCGDGEGLVYLHRFINDTPHAVTLSYTVTGGQFDHGEDVLAAGEELEVRFTHLARGDVVSYRAEFGNGDVLTGSIARTGEQTRFTADGRAVQPHATPAAS